MFNYEQSLDVEVAKIINLYILNFFRHQSYIHHIVNIKNDKPYSKRNFKEINPFKKIPTIFIFT